MDFIKELINNRKLILRLGKSDFKNRFAGTSLGAIWGFIQPFIFMAMYVIVFQYILKTKSAGDDPFIVWYLPGMAMWTFLNDAILTASNSIRAYSYLVKKVVFPVDIIPVISLSSSSIIGIFLFVVATCVCAGFGYIGNFLQVFYMVFCAIAFSVAISRLTSALATLIQDVVQLLSVTMQLFFWLTPVIWNLKMLDGHYTLLVGAKCLPLTYLVTGFRDAFINGTNIVTEANWRYTIVFWCVTIIIFLWGNAVFKKSKKDFADVL